MPKGGRREGAGRPRGSRARRTRETVAKAEALGPTPLEVLLESMHAARAEGERAEAVECAKAAAPYVHSKLAPTLPPAPVHEGLDWSVLSDGELAEFERLYMKVLKLPAGEALAPATTEAEASTVHHQSKKRGRYPRADAPSAL